MPSRSPNQRNHRRSRFWRTALVGLWASLSLALSWPTLTHWLDTTPELRPVEPGGANYVIVAAAGLAESAEAWAAYRRETGYSVRLLVVTQAESTVERVGVAVQQIYVEGGRPYPFYVLLLGHAHPRSTYPDAYLPTGAVAVDADEFSGYDEGRIASDDAYVNSGFYSDGDIAVGRIPARTNSEAQSVLARTQAYERNPPSGAGRVQVELIASASGFGALADGAIERLTMLMADRLLPAEYQWHVLWGNPNSPYSYPVAEFPAEAARRLEQGALLAAYIGHGQPDLLGWAIGPEGERGPVFAAWDAWRLHDASATVVALTACSAGRHETADSEPSVAEALILAPGGPVSVYAPSAWIYAIANFRLAQDLFQVLLVDQPATAGEWLSRAEASFGNPGADRMLSVWLFHRLLTPFATVATDHRLLLGGDARELYTLQRHAYNLFGDPALRLAYARRDLTIRPRLAWQPWRNMLSFAGEAAELLPDQAITVALVAPVNGPARPLPATGDLPDRYTGANDRVVTQASVTADREGRMSGQLALPPGLPSGAYRLIALAHDGRQTRTGAQVVHLGWPLVSLILLSPWLWWVGTTVTLVFGRLRLADHRQVHER